MSQRILAVSGSMVTESRSAFGDKLYIDTLLFCLSMRHIVSEICGVECGSH